MSSVDLRESVPHASKDSGRPPYLLAAILFCATFIMYADRVVVTQNAGPLKESFQASNEQYGAVNSWFGQGFAFGGLTFGVLADLVPVRWLYPIVVLLWSGFGAASGAAPTIEKLTLFQFFMGFFQAGHWSCALRTTQRVFKPAQRVLGNSVLQSGAAVGQIMTPLLIVGLLAWNPNQWKLAFYIAGGLGIPWAITWLLTVRAADLERPVIQTDETSAGTGKERAMEDESFFRALQTPRLWVLLVIVVAINTMWHFVRVWLPLILEDERKYSHEFVQYFTSSYYTATFFGSLASGAATGWLAGRGWNVHRARVMVFLMCGALCTLTIPAAYLPAGPLMLGLLLVIAFGSLGLFPVFYALNQEISAKHQGKVGGLLGFSAWSIVFFVHKEVGRVADQDPTLRPMLFALVGLLPLVAGVVLVLGWGRRRESATSGP